MTVSSIVSNIIFIVIVVISIIRYILWIHIRNLIDKNSAEYRNYYSEFTSKKFLNKIPFSQKLNTKCSVYRKYYNIFHSLTIVLGFIFGFIIFFLEK